MPRNWAPRAAEDDWLAPGSRGAVPGPWIVFEPPLRDRFRVVVDLLAKGMEVLRLRCRSKSTKPAALRWRDVYCDVAQPGALYHELDRVALGATGGKDRFRLELEGALDPGETLRAIALDPCDVWFNEVPDAPDLALRIAALEILPAGAAPDRPRAPFGAVRHDGEAPSDKTRRGNRDAVVFAWWIPDTAVARKVGEYYLGMLRYYHPDSRIFVGVNHGSDPAMVDMLAASGLDIEICQVPPRIAVNSDAGGFLAALDAFHQDREPFDLVWFGHTKGASRANNAYYRHIRFFLEHSFWARRAEIECAFADPRIGLLAARYNLLPPFPWPNAWPGWRDDLAALQRIYRDRYPPLGLSALDTFFILRGDIVRAFCDAVGPWFFRADPAEYGASRWFFEMAFPSIATMQGYEPFIDMDVPGNNSPRDDIMLDADVKQTHRLALEELRRWRDDPIGFRPRVLPWDRSLWQAQV
ncbi:MAG: hypothetical protein ACRDJC_10320 [Thermomicrobiales bacterium]